MADPTLLESLAELDDEPEEQHVDEEPAPQPKRGRARAVRARTLSQRTGKKEAAHLKIINDAELAGFDRPTTRAECADAPRPCPFVSCAHHLYLDVSEKTGSIKFNFPDLEPWDLTETCALDIADRGGATLEEVGEITNLTRERIRQIEVKGLTKIAALRDAAALRDYVEGAEEPEQLFGSRVKEEEMNRRRGELSPEVAALVEPLRAELERRGPTRPRELECSKEPKLLHGAMEALMRDGKARKVGWARNATWELGTPLQARRIIDRADRDEVQAEMARMDAARPGAVEQNADAPLAPLMAKARDVLGEAAEIPLVVTPTQVGEVHRVRVGGPLPAENTDAARAHLRKAHDALVRQLALVDAALASLG